MAEYAGYVSIVSSLGSLTTGCFATHFNPGTGILCTMLCFLNIPINSASCIPVIRERGTDRRVYHTEATAADEKLNKNTVHIFAS